MNRISYEKGLSVLLALVLLALGFTAVGVAKTTTITLWHQWEPKGPNDIAFCAAAREFEKRNPDIKVNVVATGLGQGILQKLTIAIAGGAPPDVAIMDERIPSYVLAGLLEPLDGFIKRDNLSPDDFWTPSFRECLWEGKLWALPWVSNPNFGFFYNKGMLGRAGIPENQPPRTIAELDRYNQKLAKRDSNGNLVEFGVVPWWTYGYANSIYTWGWAFGGSFYDEKAREVTADDPRIVKALTWMMSINDLYGPVDTLNQGLVAPRTPYQAGRLAMAAYGPWELPVILKYAPDMDFGIVPVPYDPDGGEPYPAWVGGQKVAMPSGAKHKEEAWNFMRFIAADPVGAGLSTGPNNPPAYKKAKVYEEYRRDRYMAPFVSMLEHIRNQRPVMPAAETYFWELDKAVAATLARQKTPLAALKDACRVTQAELDKILSRRK